MCGVGYAAGFTSAGIRDGQLASSAYLHSSSFKPYQITAEAYYSPEGLKLQRVCLVSRDQCSDFYRQ